MLCRSGWQLIHSSARERVDVLVYAGLFLSTVHTGFPEKLVGWASAAQRFGFSLGMRTLRLVAGRGRQEGMRRRSRCQGASEPELHAPTRRVPVSNSMSAPPCFTARSTASIRRVLANTHLYGSPAPHNPVLHLRQNF